MTSGNRQLNRKDVRDNPRQLYDEVVTLHAKPRNDHRSIQIVTFSDQQTFYEEQNPQMKLNQLKVDHEFTNRFIKSCERDFDDTHNYPTSSDGVVALDINTKNALDAHFYLIAGSH